MLSEQVVPRYGLCLVSLSIRIPCLMFDVLGRVQRLVQARKISVTFLKFPTFFFKIFKRSDPLNVDRSRLAATSSFIKFYSATTVEARLKRFQLQTMRLPSLTTLIGIGDEIKGDLKWSSFVDGKNGFFYGIPSDARRV